MINLKKTIIGSLLTASLCMSATFTASADSELITLGTKGGPSILQVERLPQSTAFIHNDKIYLFDAGYGASLRLVQSDLPLKNLQAVFITHLHSDHIADLPALLSNSWNSGLMHDISVFGPTGTQDIVDASLAVFKRDIELRTEDEGKPDLNNMVTAKDISQEVVYHKNGVKVTSLIVPHPPFDHGEALSYKIEADGKTTVITGDMTNNEAIIEFAKDADYFVSEAVLVSGVEKLSQRIGNGSTLAEAIISHHATAEEIGDIAEKANVKNLIITHLVPADDPEITDQDWIDAVKINYSGPVTIAHDLLKVKM